VPLDVTKTGTGLELLTEIDADYHRVCRLTESLEGRKQVETLPRKISTKTMQSGLPPCDSVRSFCLQKRAMTHLVSMMIVTTSMLPENETPQSLHQ
jgi:hypothetical protein